MEVQRMQVRQWYRIIQMEELQRVQVGVSMMWNQSGNNEEGPDHIIRLSRKTKSEEDQVGDTNVSQYNIIYTLLQCRNDLCKVQSERNRPVCTEPRPVGERSETSPQYGNVQVHDHSDERSIPCITFSELENFMSKM